MYRNNNKRHQSDLSGTISNKNLTRQIWFMGENTFLFDPCFATKVRTFQKTKKPKICFTSTTEIQSQDISQAQNFQILQF